MERRVVFKRVAKMAVILAVALSLGLHWALLQSVAWTGMLVTYAQQTSFHEAVTKTFDGKNPCRLCQLVRAGQQSEKKAESLLPMVKIESLPCAQVQVRGQALDAEPAFGPSGGLYQNDGHTVVNIGLSFRPVKAVEIFARALNL
ncbi:MAG: hypothetical protein EB141_17905, partial [Verrucomicrobia bacterium]|nr:hypothetical protein [Verrucomicrobiota bacterium]